MCSSQVRAKRAAGERPLASRLAGLLLPVCAALLFGGAPPARAQTAATWPAEAKHSRRSRRALRHAHTRALVAAALARGTAVAVATAAAAAFDPPEQTVGERLFLETRFAQFFAAHTDGDVNHSLPAGQGDPTLTYVQTTAPTDKILGPFAGSSINCRSCHFVDDVDNGNRTYADYTRRSPIPDRGDHLATTPRNALNMVDSSITRSAGLLLHGDGEFATVEELIDSTVTGRNFGWLPAEYDSAEAHIARIIREDDGSGTLAKDYASLSYATLFLGTGSNIPPDLVIPASYRINVATATDEEVVAAVRRLMAAYVLSLTFSRDLNGVHDGSPYDKFLAKNGLPAAPNAGETEEAYSQRLAQAVNALQNPAFVTPSDGAFQTQDQTFAFGPTELQGLKLFFRRTPDLAASRVKNTRSLIAAGIPGLGFFALGCLSFRQKRSSVLAIALAGLFGCALVACSGGNSGNVIAPATTPATAAITHVANCVACHVAPNFSDFRMHNTGASQEEYDSIHGDGSFAQLEIPGYAERQANRDQYLPPTPRHPNSSGRFRSPASATDATLADLGLWNVYANTDYPGPQPRLQAILCPNGATCDPNTVLPQSIGRFKTPVLRDLAQSQPYLHTGRMDTLERVLDFYRHSALLAQAGALRNADPQVGLVSIDDTDETYLAAFLRSLNEDYQ